MSDDTPQYAATQVPDDAVESESDGLFVELQQLKATVRDLMLDLAVMRGVAYWSLRQLHNPGMDRDAQAVIWRGVWQEMFGPDFEPPPVPPPPAKASPHRHRRPAWEVWSE